MKNFILGFGAFLVSSQALAAGYCELSKLDLESEVATERPIQKQIARTVRTGSLLLPEVYSSDQKYMLEIVNLNENNIDVWVKVDRKYAIRARARRHQNYGATDNDLALLADANGYFYDLGYGLALSCSFTRD